MEREMLDNLLRQRALPALRTAGSITEKATREDWLDALAEGEYGWMPPAPAGVEIRELKRVKGAFGGKAMHLVYQLSCHTPGGRMSFPFHLVLPEGSDPVPVFLQVSFFNDMPNPSCPVTDIVDRGFAVASFRYVDVSPDRADSLDEGMAGRFNASRRAESGCGTIGYWAWAAERITDFLTTHPRVDAGKMAIIGHSRLGKTALWAGANDTRYALTVSVQSGCSGAAITRGKVGEKVAEISKAFPHWFCPRYAGYADREAEMPFEQHFLLAAVAPRLLYVCSAREDQWADPESEFLGCVAASEAWALAGGTGFETPDALPETGTVLHDGQIGYHLRSGGHALEPEDWRHVMDFWAKHLRDD